MKTNLFKGKKILITAGPTREAIDPVRFISNHSSGKMGYALAEAFLKQGAEVVLVSGPVSLSLSHPDLQIVKVNTAMDMWLACCHYFEEADIIVFAAAVADYRAARIETQKIKKDDGAFTIRLVKNIDIAHEFGKLKTPGQLTVGFALETNDELLHAKRKLDKKHFDMVVLNSMKDENACFGYDTNKIQTIRRDFTRRSYRLKHKSAVAEDILCEIDELIQERKASVQKLELELYECSNY